MSHSKCFFVVHITVIDKNQERGLEEEHVKAAQWISNENIYHPLTPPMAICVATEYFSATGPEFFPKRRFHHRCRLAYSVRSTTLS